MEDLNFNVWVQEACVSVSIVTGPVTIPTLTWGPAVTRPAAQHPACHHLTLHTALGPQSHSLQCQKYIALDYKSCILQNKEKY